MRVDVSPRQCDILPGVGLPLRVTITNTGTVIGGYTIRVLGADPGWVHLEDEQVSLFPEESRTILVQVTPPRGIAAGARRIAIQVRELTPPLSSAVVDVDLTVPASRQVQLRVDPLAVTAGKRASYSVILENAGNTVVTGVLGGDDAESKVHFRFVPEGVTLAPGEHALVDMRASSRRPLLGAPAVRMLGLYLDEPPGEGFFSEPVADDDAPANPPRDERKALGTATFIQKPLLSRGSVGLFGLLAAITVFALVITFALSRLVGQNTADRNLALQVAAAANNRGGAGGGTAGVSGTVRDLSTGKPVGSVSVALFQAADATTPIATTATSGAGTYLIGNLAAGSYKISYQGANFQQIWYPAGLTAADAQAVQLNTGTQRTGLDVTIGGLPASISGTVVGQDVATATLYLMKPPDTTGTAPAAVAAAPVTPTGSNAPAAAPPPDNGDAIVQSVPIGADGKFALTSIPSPSTYDLVVTKTGYATTTQRLDVGAGEDRSGIDLTLSTGDGVISGTVNSSAGPLGDVTITATAGQSSVTTVSLTGSGTFTLRGLPTPATFTVQAALPGYAQQTETLSLSAAEKLTGVAITLSKSSASLSGLVTLAAGNAPAPGVTVTVTNGSTTVQTSTQSAQGGAQGIGAWTVTGLPVPNSYTITFSRSDLASQTVSVSLDANGQITPGSRGAVVDSSGTIRVVMQSATATIMGVVSQVDPAAPGGKSPVGEATVALSSGATTFTVTTASVPAPAQKGAYRIDGVPPGTWTISVNRPGTSPTSSIVTLSAGQVLTYSPVLVEPASISGYVCADATVTPPCTSPLSGVVVVVYVASQYPTVVSYTTTTNGQGYYSFPYVNAPQVYVVAIRATASSSDLQTQNLSVGASQAVTANFSVPR
ncbi:MAG: hypothetical protein EPN43_02190 [Jatrophihabitans sp.]|nr:MAG: hypothetical protein EPN43_02190 [Jatrophihabitans sp.]